MSRATFVSSTTRPDQLPEDDRPHVAIVGRSNVGKSSVINHLFQSKDLARVSSKAGRTATINLFDVDGQYYMVDLPGYGFTSVKAKREGFAELILGYLSKTPQLKLVLIVIDAYVGPVDLDVEMFEYLHARKIPMLIIVNKIDKLTNSQSIALMRTLNSTYSFAKFIPHSIKSGAHRGEILETITVALRET